MKKIRIKVKGRVQGVGFRYTTKMVADQLNIHGIAENNLDGSVTIEATGEEEAIDAFIKKIKASPSPVARVTSIDIKEDDAIKVRDKFIAR